MMTEADVEGEPRRRGHHETVFTNLYVVCSLNERYKTS